MLTYPITPLFWTPAIRRDKEVGPDILGQHHMASLARAAGHILELELEYRELKPQAVVNQASPHD